MAEPNSDMYHPPCKATGVSQSLAVLLAKENHIDQIIIVKMLEKLNLNLIVTQNGHEAFEAFKRSQYDVILMDFHMPVMGGVETTKMIRQHEKAHSLPRTPIVAFTRTAMSDQVRQCFEADMDDYMSIPLERNLLIQLIHKHGHWTPSPQEYGQGKLNNEHEKNINRAL
jgi:osomolarity two-component system, sensor histidine kinase NIK1